MVPLGLRMHQITGFKILKFLSDPKASVSTRSVVYALLCDYGSDAIAVITVTRGLDTKTRLMGHFPLY